MDPQMYAHETIAKDYIYSRRLLLTFCDFLKLFNFVSAGFREFLQPRDVSCLQFVVRRVCPKENNRNQVSIRADDLVQHRGFTALKNVNTDLEST